MKKLYCYVDETGQDTKGVFFLVALVLFSEDRSALRNTLRHIEKRSGKITRKWMKTTLQQKEAYLKDILNVPALQHAIFYVHFPHTTDYLSCVIEAIARGIAKKAERDYKAVILIDGLGKHERKAVGARLRVKKVHTEKVRGVRDESDEFIRLADAIAGFVRDYLEGRVYSIDFYHEALRKRIIERL